MVAPARVTHPAVWEWLCRYEDDMADEQTRNLMLTKYYCTERALEVKADLARLQAEGNELKIELDSTTDLARQTVIRQRRSYLKRRNDELKVQREALARELQTALDALKSLAPSLGAKKKRRLGWSIGPNS